MFKSLVEFDAFVERDIIALRNGQPPAGVCTCMRCGVPLQESMTGFRPVGPDGIACSDCYFAIAGEVFATSNIPGRRGLRGA